MPDSPEIPEVPIIDRHRTPARGVPVGQADPIIARDNVSRDSYELTVTAPASPSLPPTASVIVPPPASAVVQVVDRIGDIVGVIVVGMLAQHRIVDGTFACGIILAILGVQSGFRSLGRKVSASGTAAGLGILALAVVFLTASNFDRTV